MTDREDRLATASTKTERTFKKSECEEISYRIIVATDKFNLEAFTEALQATKRSDYWSGPGIICAGKGREADYHLHIWWKAEKDETSLKIGYFSGSVKPEKHAAQPSAEHLIEWIGQFFQNDNVEAHVHADFELSANARCKFPLPIRTSIGPLLAEVDGVSARLLENPSGVSKVWMTQLKESLSVQLAADRRLVFKGFSPIEDIREFRSIVDSMIEEKRP